MTTTHYTAFVTYRLRNAAGELEEKTAAQDVTDEINEGADREELVDRIYWKQICGLQNLVDIVRGGVTSEVS